MLGYYERLFQAMNQHSLINSSSCSTGDDGAVNSLSAAAAAAAGGVVASTIPMAATAVAETNSSDHAAEESILLRTTSSSNRAGRKKKKIFPTAHLPNEERDELHMEIYKYFEWLHNSLVAASASGAAGSARGSNDENEGDEDELSGRRRRQKKEQSASSAGGGVSGGINISSLHQLMQCMESTFKVVGNSQISSESASSTDTLATTATTKMPFLEEALSEPLRKLAAISKRNSENQQQQQQQSRWKNSRRGSTTSASGVDNYGLDFEDMFARLLQFHQEHGHVNVPQKYAPDGQLGSWVANIRSKRKLMSKRGEEFEPDIESSPIPDPAEYDDIVVGDENNVVFEDEEDEGDVALGDEDDGGGSGGVDLGVVDEDFNRKKRKRVGGRQRLTQERIQRLDTIGFQWVVSNSNTKSWEERFENLKEYQQYHGTTRVPRSSGTLGEWVHMQRRLYNKKDKNFLATRAPLLDAIGFDWHPRKYALVSWEDNFNRLVDFGRTHMHYNVQSPFPDDFLGDIEDQSAELVEAHRFAKWVKRIHSEYRSYATGKEGRMLNDARVMQLREIGFQFV
ncbi:hypothetical protein ACHAWU_002064 [Discostella pseudostelligera]|uniref:Helicase-associated domain-containing protein n=1 Tax=Discostella pseudostelligera TaxID=259834 RepID=A0ABD3M8N6_9STRA